MLRYQFMIVVLVASLCAPATFAAMSPLENLRGTSKAFADVAATAGPSVVFIEVEKDFGSRKSGRFGPGGGSPFGDEFFRRFFGFPGGPSPYPEPSGETPRAVGQGSGFIFARRDSLLSDKTYVLTNNHVIEGADRIRVSLQDGRRFDATVTGVDPASDIAVIEFDASDLKAIPLGDSAALDVGEWVIAIGNPFGLDHTLTVGVVSAKGRSSVGITDYEDFIQTDAAINPGNSGGPLLNLDGEVVGMNTAIFSRSGGYMGLGFAIPINLAKSVAEQLIEHGEVTRGYLGVVIQALTPDLAASFGLDDAQGVLIAQVAENSPAQAAGIKTGDIVINLDGQPVSDVGQLRNAIALSRPGTNKDVAVLRNGKRRKITVKIAELDHDTIVATTTGSAESSLGLTVQPLTSELAQKLGIDPQPGVVVTEVTPRSTAAAAGIRKGMVIVEINRRLITDLASFRKALKDAEKAQRALLLVRSGTMQSYLALQW